MSKTFPDSVKLKEIVERHNWRLYSLINPFSWEQLEKETPAQQYQVGQHYVFVRKPGLNQSLKDACAEVGYLGPSLSFTSEDEQMIRGHNDVVVNGRHTYLISRLYFSDLFVLANAPPGLYSPEPVLLRIDNCDVADIFRQRFGITTRKELLASKTPHIIN